MRKVRVLFNNVLTLADLSLVLSCLDNFGKLHQHSFDFQGVGFGEVLLCTDRETAHMEEQLHSLLPHMMIGMEELKEEECHDCRMAA